MANENVFVCVSAWDESDGSSNAIEKLIRIACRFDPTLTKNQEQLLNVIDQFASAQLVKVACDKYVHNESQIPTLGMAIEFDPTVSRLRRTKVIEALVYHVSKWCTGPKLVRTQEIEHTVA